jgi:hypothetical protein
MTVAPVWGGSARRAQPAARAALSRRSTPRACVVTDEDGATVDAGGYLVNAATGRVTPGGAAVFTGSAYVVTARAGLSLRADYAEAIEPVMS